MFYDENLMFPVDYEGGFRYKDICKTSYWCFWNMLNYGLRFGGGIGDVMMNVPKSFNESGTKIFLK